jgi:hypothetical protein
MQHYAYRNHGPRYLIAAMGKAANHPDHQTPGAQALGVFYLYA